MPDILFLKGQILKRRLVSAPDSCLRCVPIIILIIMLLSGCLQTSHPISLADLENPNPVMRIKAVKWVGENKNSQTVPKLLELSQDEDQAVRFYAIIALRNITQTDLGFDYQADARRRAEAVNQWKKRFVIIEPEKTNRKTRGVRPHPTKVPKDN